MKLRNKILIISYISIALMIVLGFIFYKTFQEINKSVERRTLSQNIIVDIFDLNILISDYVLNPGERAKIQWFSKYESLGNNIKKGEEGEWAIILKDTRSNYNGLKPLFSEFVNYAESPSGRSQELGAMLRGRMLLESQEIVSISKVLPLLLLLWF